jgi:uncharacterized protein YjbJ (UPF0337 family)
VNQSSVGRAFSENGTTPASLVDAHRSVSRKECVMNWDQIKGEWREAKGKLRSKWGKLTDDDLEQIAGKKDILIGRLQQRYGWKKDQAEESVDDYLKKL